MDFDTCHDSGFEIMELREPCTKQQAKPPASERLGASSSSEFSAEDALKEDTSYVHQAFLQKEPSPSLDQDMNQQCADLKLQPLPVSETQLWKQS